MQPGKPGEPGHERPGHRDRDIRHGLTSADRHGRGRGECEAAQWPDRIHALPVARQAATTFSRAWIEQVPNLGHNVLGEDECSRLIRNAWVSNPASAPASTSCLSTLHLLHPAGSGARCVSVVWGDVSFL
jgi:hypothetical protein